MSRNVKIAIILFTTPLMFLPIILATMKVSQKSGTPVTERIVNALPVSWTSAVGLCSGDPVFVGNWPPIAGEPYPNLILTDQTGQTVKLSDFSGKTILVEYVATPCKGCQSFAGAGQKGSFGDFGSQPGLESIETYARRFAGVDLGTDEVVFVQILLYGETLSAPTQREVAAWAEHFDMDRNENQIVLRGDSSMLSRDTYEMIPGFQLIDRDFILRSDSCGHNPVDNLYQDLLPLLGEMARTK